MNGILTGFFGAIVEAWAQLRIGKLRVLLSLVGVAAAVAAMTFVIALGQVSVDAINKVSEKYTGRPGTVTINVSPTGKGLDQASARASGLMEAAEIAHAERIGAPLRLQPARELGATARLIDPLPPPPPPPPPLLLLLQTWVESKAKFKA